MGFSTTQTLFPKVRIGVLALQGAFLEHENVLNRMKEAVSEVVQVRTVCDLYGPTDESMDTEGSESCVDALILPGGESTAIALIAEQEGLLHELEKWIKKEKRPVWGTCAGMIMLANNVVDTKTGGQPLLGGLNVTVMRNYFGSQMASFQMDIQISKLDRLDTEDLFTSPKEKDQTLIDPFKTHPLPFRGIFIRSPIIVCMKNTVHVLGWYPRVPTSRESESCPSQREMSSTMTGSASEESDYIVAVQEGHILATCFHPELTGDDRFHQHFVKMAQRSKLHRLQSNHLS